MPHVATCSGSSSGSNNSNAHVNVNLVNATKHSTATAATTTRNNNEWNNSIGHCCGNLPLPLPLSHPWGWAHPLGLPDFTCASMSTFMKLVGNMTSCQRCHPAAQTRPLADVGNQGIQRPSHAAAVASWGMVARRGEGGKEGSYA